MAQGCYVPQYFPASFRGVQFEAEEITSEHGRRGATGEFPFGESTAYADLGRSIRRYNLKGRYVNNAHLASSSALIAACETPGPGLLIHPARGAILVACVKLTVTDDPLNGQGYTQLDMEFVEANEISAGLTLGGSIFGLSLAAMSAAIGAGFDLVYDLNEVQYYNVSDVENSLAEGMDAITIEFSKAAHKSQSNANWSALSTMQNLVSDPSQLRNSTDAFTAFKRATRTLANATTGQTKYDSFKTIANKMAQSSTLTYEAQDAQNGVYAMVRLLATINMVKAALETSVTTIDYALAQYDEVVAIIAQELAAARAVCDDCLYIELRKFETETKTSLLNRAYNFPALVAYNFSGTVPSLLAAYDIFDDAKRFAEIETRNPSSWPWAVGPTVIAAKV